MGASSTCSRSHKPAQNKLHLGHRWIFMGLCGVYYYYFPHSNWKFQIRCTSHVCFFFYLADLAHRATSPPEDVTRNWRASISYSLSPLWPPQSSALPPQPPELIWIWNSSSGGIVDYIYFRQRSPNISLTELWISIKQQQDSTVWPRASDFIISIPSSEERN